MVLYVCFDLNTGVTLCVELLFGRGTSLVFCDSSGFCVWNSMHYLTAWNKSHIRKLFIQTFATILFLLSLDAGLGFHGWSVQYGMSCSILVLDLFLGGGMLINRTNWTSYLTTQVYAIALAVINLCIGIFAKEGNPLFAWIVLLVTLVLFGVAVLAGSRKAKSELRRRFYI